MKYLHGKPFVELSNHEIDSAGIREEWERWFNQWTSCGFDDRTDEPDFDQTDWTKDNPL